MFWQANAVVLVTISNNSCLLAGPLAIGLKNPIILKKNKIIFLIIDDIPNGS